MWRADCIEVCDEEAGDEGEVYVDVSGWREGWEDD